MGNAPTLDEFDDRLVAHDLRHLLGLVHGYAQVLSAIAADPVTEASLRRMILATQRASDLCEDWQRAKAPEALGQLDPGIAQTLVATETVVREVVELCAERAARAGVALKVEIGNDLPSFRGDSTSLQRAILNLVWNALEVVAEGSGEISLRAFRCERSEDLCLEVADNGPGLPERYLGDLTWLSPGGREGWPRSEGGELHGFGLLVVAGFARRADGSFVGESNGAELGSRMRLRLPAAGSES